MRLTGRGIDGVTPNGGARALGRGGPRRRRAADRTARRRQEAMRKRFVAVIEGATDRRVVGFMSGNQQAPT
jgi:hypothetical protein